jgi:hypothetical protein
MQLGIIDEFKTGGLPEGTLLVRGITSLSQHSEHSGDVSVPL